MGVPNDLERSIYATVAWFSLFEYPVTVFEIWKWLWNLPERPGSELSSGRAGPPADASLEAVYDALEKSVWLR